MKWLSLAGCLAVLCACLFSLSPETTNASTLQETATVRFELKRGDHICLIGNNTADRMQHMGWLETLLHSRFPEYQLVVRNLGFAGDTLTTRLRSANFGTPDEWLTKCKADVVFAFFGYNESFAGKEGLAAFKSELDSFITHTLSQKYNGKSTPRLVLFSPLAHENLNSPNLPDGKANNERLKLYSEAMRDAAARFRITFVDLFTSSQVEYGNKTSPLTINGIHLNEHGDQVMARAIEKSLFISPINKETEYLEKLRAAINDKNFYWFQRYRTTDGYSIYGGRADLKFVNNQTNREVAQREMEVLDVMTANRDKHVWSVAQNKPAKVDDSNLPAFIPVISNKPGKGPNGQHLFLSGEEAIQSMKIAKGFKVNLFADEKMFPELINPVQMQFDTKGRLWVATWQTYPHWKPTEAMNDSLLILEDTDGDGKADKRTVFAGDLHNPTGFEFYNGGVMVAQAPNIVFLKDTNGDDKCDSREIVLSGIDSADTHHTANSFVFGPDGALYFQEGTFHHTSVETPYSAPVRCANAGVFRYEPRTQKFETYISFGFANPHGHVFDKWGRDIVVDGTGSNPYHAALFSGHMEYPNKHRQPPQVYQQWTRPCSGMELLSSKHFPDELQGNLLVLNVIGYQGILMYKLRDKGASIEGIEDTRLLSSSDPNFRPADIKIGPDGAIYFCDWHNPIIGHMQHNLRDPNRDRTHGRVYRMTYEGRPLSDKVTVAGEPIEKLLQLLMHPEERVRYRARVELSTRKTDEVLKAATAWLDALLQKPGDHAQEELEILWLFQQHNTVFSQLVHRLMKSQHGHVRAAAVRVLCYWRDRYPASYDEVPAKPSEKVGQTNSKTNSNVSDAEQVKKELQEINEKLEKMKPNRVTINDSTPNRSDLVYRGPEFEWPVSTLTALHSLCNDPDPRVRLEVARAASFLTEPEAVEIPLLIQQQPMDQYLTFVCQETMRTLEPIWKRHLALGKPFKMRTHIGNRFLVRNMNNTLLLKMERNADVCRELLTRPGIQDEYRLDALRNLTRMFHRSPAAMLVETLTQLDQEKDISDTSIFFDLVRLLAGRKADELKEIRPQLIQLALTARQPVIRQVGYVALMTVDGQVQSAWKLVADAKDKVSAQIDLATATSLLSDGSLREEAYNELMDVLDKSGTSTKLAPPAGRYVRIDIPGKNKTLTLAEVEVFSQGKNIARTGKATQSATSHGGVAARAIDGKTSGRYADGGQTHTPENGSNPWWELDLGSEQPIESIAIYNRTEEKFHRRLDGYTITVLNDLKQPVWQKTAQPAPEKMVTHTIAPHDPQAQLRSAVMLALTTVRGHEKKTFETIAKRLQSPADQSAAMQAILRLPKNTWPVEQAKPLLEQTLKILKAIPVNQRTGTSGSLAMELVDSLTMLLPADQARPFRKELMDLGVRVIRIGTLLERMSYDKDVIVVQAGKPVEFIFENTDMMPHNLVISEPGTLETIGEAAEAMATSPEAASRHFVPPSDKILLASKLLQPRESQRLSFTAPKTPGVYPIVCTYPGHWRRMYAAFYVVNDLEGYQTGPDAYLASHPVTIKDAMLKDRRPRTEWKYADLEPLLVDLKSGRSFSNGKQMFKVATCQACHRLENVGNNFAPDLFQLDPKWKPADVLRHIVEPSHLINEKYQTWTFATIDGKTITAIVLEETPDNYKIIENPLVKAEPMILKKSDIEQKQKSNVSTMPKGLLDTLSRDEILDLLAYLLSQGKPDNEMFKGDGHKH